ncbi:unnamed protein product [Prorocentrum cordatum]|uniref:mRNA (guanine-N(7))-methyltransferase n=1 Tax=Prorocentrum cordatum TaxID=2364126 RepID=A0ABN9PKA1_9DINO|nr:unnamed protein product [Polarella glacialis]
MSVVTPGPTHVLHRGGAASSAAAGRARAGWGGAPASLRLGPPAGAEGAQVSLEPLTQLECTVNALPPAIVARISAKVRGRGDSLVEAALLQQLQARRAHRARAARPAEPEQPRPGAPAPPDGAARGGTEAAAVQAQPAHGAPAEAGTSAGAGAPEAPVGACGVAAAAVAAARARLAPEASAEWCRACEVLRACEGDIWPEAAAVGQAFNSMHVGEQAATSVFALGHLIACGEGRRGLKWRWRGVAEHPHFEGRAGASEWPEAENALFCHSSDCWFPTEDGSGRVLSGPSWRVEALWTWVWQENAAGLQHLVVASSPARGAAACASGVEHAALATLVAAVGVLRVGGVLLQTVAPDSPELEVLAALCAVLFERCEVVAPRLGGPEVCLVGARFRGTAPALLQALVVSVRRALSGRQADVLSPEWVRELRLPNVARWALQQRDGLQSSLVPLGPQATPSPTPPEAEAYLSYLGLRRIPEQRHLLWSCWPDFLRREAGRGSGGRGPSPERPRGLQRHAQLASWGEPGLQEQRRSRWREAEAHAASPGPAAKRRRLEPAAGPRARDEAAGSCTGGSARRDGRGPAPGDGAAAPWFHLDAEVLSHRALLRSLKPGDAAVQVAQSNWWRSSLALEPWAFWSSPFASPQKLRALIVARSRAPSWPPERHPMDMMPALEDDELPPAVVVALVDVMSRCLPERLAGRAHAQPGPHPAALEYRRGLHVVAVEPEAARGLQAHSWLTRRMGVRTTQACAWGSRTPAQSAEELVQGCLRQAGLEDPVRDGPGPVDLVVVEAPPPEGEAGREVAWAELDADAKLLVVASVLVGLRALAAGGDLLVQLPSLYTRFLAGLVVLLASGFDRVTVVRPGSMPAWWGQRWLVCNRFAASDQSKPRAAGLQKLLATLWDRLRALPAGETFMQVVPASLLCTGSGRALGFFCQANDEVIDAELEFWSSSSASSEPVSECPERSRQHVLFHLARSGLKPWLFFFSEDGRRSERARVGLYFGTFDPLHENHFRMVLCALSACGLSRVVLVPNQSGNPYKPQASSLQGRIDCIRARILEAEATEQVRPGQISARLVEGANNWPQREGVARALEREELAETTTAVEVLLLLGEDSLDKALREGAGKHKNTGIFQLKLQPRRLLVFPRGGGGPAIRERLPDFLRSLAEVAPYQDLVPGLSSGSLRDRLRPGGAEPPADWLHPAARSSVWRLWRGRLPGGPGLPTAAAPCGPPRSLGGCLAAAAPPVHGGGVAGADPRLHYASQRGQSADERLRSLSVRLRNFNSFAKAVLLERHLGEVRDRLPSGEGRLAVLDLGCGRGGDLKKMVNCGVASYCGADVSEASLHEAVRRVGGLLRDSGRFRHGLLGGGGALPLREVSLLRADCWREDVALLLDAAGHGTARLQGEGRAWFHLVSSQMACHYAFESRDQGGESLLRRARSTVCRAAYSQNARKCTCSP